MEKYEIYVFYMLFDILILKIIFLKYIFNWKTQTHYK